MKINCSSRFIVLFSALSALLAVGCSKEEEETTRSYLEGSLSVGYVQPYHYCLDTLEFTLKGVSYPSTDTDTTHKLGVYYTIVGVMDSPDTVFNALTNPYKEGCKFKMTLPDSLATYSILISIYPSASDLYYTSSNTVSVVTVDDYLTIPEISPYRMLRSEIYTDPRDSREYAVIIAGGKEWLNRNLAYSGTQDSTVGIPYAKSECMNYVFGRFYTWNEAQTVCPDGWRLPSSDEWSLLGNVSGDLMVDAWFNEETRLWEFWPDVKITNRTMMGFIPAGYCNTFSLQFDGTLEYASFWTSDSEHGYGVYRYVYVRDADFKRALLDPDSVSMPVRCVRDIQ